MYCKKSNKVKINRWNPEYLFLKSKYIVGILWTKTRKLMQAKIGQFVLAISLSKKGRMTRDL